MINSYLEDIYTSGVVNQKYRDMSVKPDLEDFLKKESVPLVRKETRKARNKKASISQSHSRKLRRQLESKKLQLYREDFVLKNFIGLDYISINQFSINYCAGTGILSKRTLPKVIESLLKKGKLKVSVVKIKSNGIQHKVYKLK